MTSRSLTAKCAALACLFGLLTTTSRSHAAAPDSATARDDGARPVQDVLNAAAEAFKAGRYEEALTGFEEARARTGQIGILYPIARCYEELGRLEDALSAYEQVAAATSVPDEARGKADSAARLLRERLATGRLVLQVSPFGAAVTIDGQDAGVAPIAPVDVTPGTYTVAVRRAGFEAVTREVEVRGGRTDTVVIELAALPDKPDETSNSTLGAPSIWPWVALGVGGALSIGGAVSVWSGEQDHLEITEAEGYAEGQLVGMSRDRALELEASGDDKKLVGWVLVGVGGALMVGSAVWAVLDSPTEGEATVAPVVTGVPGGAAFGAVGRF